MRYKTLMLFAPLILYACALHPVEQAGSGYLGLRLPAGFKLVSEIEGEAKLAGLSGEFIVIRERPAVSEEQAINEARRRWELLKDILSPKVDPYFGARDLGPTCDEKALPPSREISSPKSIVKTGYLFATADLVFGACSDELDRLKAQILWLYCRNSKKFYDVRFFFPRSKLWNDLPIAACK